MDQSKKLEQLIKYIRSLEQQVKNQGAFPAGHYYSPVPSHNDVLEYLDSRSSNKTELPDIALNKKDQFKLLENYQGFYDELPFPEKQQQGFRYYYDNNCFSYSDAIFLYSFLRKHQPKRIIEIGSGFSSAVMLDTIDKFIPFHPEITFIEPYPDRLNSLLASHDREQVKLINKRIQVVPPELFLSLEAGDLLFIDSTHVVKCGSDLQQLLFNILPLLPVGIFVHFHDVFYPFDYPSDWLEKGRYWNENYFLRAFLSHNSDWNIYFFNHYSGLVFKDYITEKMPLCLKGPGGSLYIQRVKITSEQL